MLCFFLSRLDKDDKLSEHLKLAFFAVIPDFKLPLLVYILNFVVKKSDQVLIFAATKHHVEFIEAVLNLMRLPSVSLYSDMDPTLRRINTAKFQKRMVNILIGTDIAARGIDIPSLDYVINYDFPSSAKVFIHRVGRVARAGRTGVALNFVTSDEEAYLFDLHLFLGRSVMFSPKVEPGSVSSAANLGMDLKQTSVINDKSNHDSSKTNNDWNFFFGSVPDVITSHNLCRVGSLLGEADVKELQCKMVSATKLYERTRQKASREALREWQDSRNVIPRGPHPLLLHSITQHIALTPEDQDSIERRMIVMEQLADMRLKNVSFALLYKLINCL